MTATDITSRPVTVLVTGPTRGLGLEAARALVARAPHVRLALLGRAGTTLDAVAAELRRPGRTAEPIGVDFASLAEVRAAAARVRSLVADGALGPLDALVLNAGIQTVDRRHETSDGVELTFGVNVLAPFVLVQELLGVLAPGAHVVLVGSGTHTTDRSTRLVAHPRWEDPADLARPGIGDDADTPVAGQRAYATSKLAVNHLCHELQRRHGDRLRSNVHDPGLMPGTGLARDMSRVRRFLWDHVMPHLPLPGTSTPERSGAVLAELALGLRFGDLRAGYVDIDQVTRASDESHDEGREARLWEVLEQLDATTGRAHASR